MSYAVAVPSAIVALVAFIGIVASVTAIARASYAKERILGLQGDRDDLFKRVEMLEAENIRVSEALDSEKAKVRVLEQLVTGKEQLDHIQETLDAQNRTTAEWRSEQRKIALDLLGLLGGQRDGEVQHT